MQASPHVHVVNLYALATSSSFLQTIRTLKSTLVVNVGQILREGTPSFSLFDLVKIKAGFLLPCRIPHIPHYEGRGIARCEEVDLKWEGGKRMVDLFSI